LDIKCPSSGEEAKMDFSNFDHLKAGDQVKFIIADEQDYSHAVKVYSSYLQNAEFEIIFTPCDFEPSDVIFSLQTLAEKVLNDGLEVRVLPQLHKILWPSKKHGV
jgi:7-carboxy-7-deazaguanine synthase